MVGIDLGLLRVGDLPRVPDHQGFLAHQNQPAPGAGADLPDRLAEPVRRRLGGRQVPPDLARFQRLSVLVLREQVDGISAAQDRVPSPDAERGMSAVGPRVVPQVEVPAEVRGRQVELAPTLQFR